MNPDDELHAAALQREHVWTPTKLCYWCGTHRKHATSPYCAGEETR